MKKEYIKPDVCFMAFGSRDSMLLGFSNNLPTDDNTDNQFSNDRSFSTEWDEGEEE